jgi:hypothetical protein
MTEPQGDGPKPFKMFARQLWKQLGRTNAFNKAEWC